MNTPQETNTKELAIKLLDHLDNPQQERVLGYIQGLLAAHTPTASEPTRAWQPGVFKGKVHMAAHFDEPLEELQDYM